MIKPLDLDDGWRVSSDGIQWLLQRRNKSGWDTVAYCATREGLESMIFQHLDWVDRGITPGAVERKYAGMVKDFTSVHP